MSCERLYTLKLKSEINKLENINMYATIHEYHSFDRVYKERYNDSYKEHVVLLILYNPNSDYEQIMKGHLTTYLETVKNITFYFIAFRDQHDHLTIDTNSHCMFFKGTEGFMPNILQKTLHALEYTLANIPFTYIIRSNISTVIDMSHFPYNEMIGKDYASGWTFTLNWLNPFSGIHDRRLFGLRFASGTNIILSRNAVQYIIDHKHNVDETIMDDVAIGLLLSTSPYNLHQLSNIVEINQVTSTHPLHRLAYRHKSKDRMEDAEMMHQLILRIIERDSLKK